MHWLPLVAMVIASALPFPYSPVTRIVAATTETSGSHGGGGGGELPPPPPPLAAPAHNCSDGNGSRDPYHADPGPGGLAGPEDRRTTRSSEPLPERSTPEKSRTGAAGRDGERSDGGSYRDASGVSSQGEPSRTSNFSCDDANVSADAAVARDFRLGGADARDPTRKENFRDSLDRGILENHDSPSPLPVPGSGLVSPATGQQRGPGPLSKGERSRVTTETGAGFLVSEGEGRSPGTDGGTERPGGAAGMKGRAGLGSGDDPESGMDGVQEVDELFLDAHPRVLFSPSASPPQHPPLLLMLESGALPEGEGYAGGGGEHAAYDPLDGEGASPSWAAVHAGNRRMKRSDLSDLRRGERSVCESESVWVTDKKTAVDNHGRIVTILPIIQTPTGPLRQYFYETRCRRGEQRRASRAGGAEASLGLGVAGSGCLGVDKKQWKSECKAKHSFVRALAKDASNRMGWRWIRIDSSCVCVLLARVNRQVGGKV